MKCRICGSRGLTEYLNLGEQPLADAFLTREQFDTEAAFPLAVMYCGNCSLSQLSYVVPPEILYKDDYPYETGMNNGGVKHFRRMARSLRNRFKPNFVVDIGSNDGTLLKGFSCKTCGIEPVKEIAEKAGVFTVNAFWGAYGADQALLHGGRADIITACNVFAHIDNLHGFMWNVDRLLADDGVFVVEAPYLPDMIDNLAFDTVYHEHLSYLSMKPMMHLMREYGMVIFDVKHFPDIHCGTMRYYIARKGVYEFTRACDDYYYTEQKYHDIEVLKKAGRDFFLRFHDFRPFLKRTQFHDKTVVGVSAPAKGNTFLNILYRETHHYFNLPKLKYITDKSERKIGKLTPGTHIPIVPDSKLIEDQPDYAIILAWNWADQIKDSLKDFKGEWIIPNEKGLKNLCSGTQRTCGECDCSGVKEKGVHECCGVSCGTDEQVSDVHPV